MVETLRSCLDLLGRFIKIFLLFAIYNLYSLTSHIRLSTLLYRTGHVAKQMTFTWIIIKQFIHLLAVNWLITYLFEKQSTTFQVVICFVKQRWHTESWQKGARKRLQDGEEHMVNVSWPSLIRSRNGNEMTSSCKKEVLGENGDLRRDRHWVKRGTGSRSWTVLHCSPDSSSIVC